MVSRTHFGIVKSFNPEKGWGHIESDETHALYGKDMFVLRSQLLGMDSIRKGDQVKFAVQEGTKGPEAASVQLINLPTMGAYHFDMSSLGYLAPGAATCIGIVKSWNPEKGWGHIECESTHALFGKDVFLMRSHLVGIQDVSKGQPVSFSCTQGSRGPEAENVRVLSGGAGMNNAHLAPGKGSGLVGMASTQAFTGTVKSYNEEKGWGHIACDATRAVYQKDIFFMRSALNGASVKTGYTVQFGITMEVKGPEASSIIVLQQHPQSGGGDAGSNRIYSGAVKMYNPEKGWGFLISAESQRDWGKDIFVHSKDFSGIIPRQGDTFEFSVAPGKDGRPEACGVVPVAAGSNDGGYGGHAAGVSQFQRYSPY